MKKLYNIHMNNRDVYTYVADSELKAIYRMCNSWLFRDSYGKNDNYDIERIETITDSKAVYEHLAVSYAEKYGICEYHINGRNMIYYTTFPMEHMTYKAVVNLDTTTETRQPLKNYYKPYKSLICGKYQANYCA